MNLKQDYDVLLVENQKLKRDLKSKQSFISTILKQKKELNKQVSLLFSELERFKGFKASRFHLRTLKMHVKEAMKLHRLQNPE